MPQSSLPPLSEAQREIMEIIWDRQEATVSEVREALSATRPLARNTVQTMIARLEEKGWLKHRTSGRTFVYSAKVPQRSSLGAKVAQIVDRMFSGSADELMTALMEYRGLSDEEAERIRKMIDESDSPSVAKGKSAKSQSSRKRRK